MVVIGERINPKSKRKPKENFNRNDFLRWSAGNIFLILEDVDILP